MVLLGSEDYDLTWFRGLWSCVVQRIVILLGSEDCDLTWFRGLWSCVVQKIMILLCLRALMILLSSDDLWSCLVERIYDLAWFRGLRSCLVEMNYDFYWFRGYMILVGREDLWSCLVERIYDLAWFRGYDPAWFRGFMIHIGGQDLWSCEDECIYDLVRTSVFMILWGRVYLWSCEDEWIYDLVRTSGFMILLGCGNYDLVWFLCFYDFLRHSWSCVVNHDRLCIFGGVLSLLWSFDLPFRGKLWSSTNRKLVILVILRVMERMADPTVHWAERGLIFYLMRKELHWGWTRIKILYDPVDKLPVIISVIYWECKYIVR